MLLNSNSNFVTSLICVSTQVDEQAEEKDDREKDDDQAEEGWLYLIVSQIADIPDEYASLFRSTYTTNIKATELQSIKII